MIFPAFLFIVGVSTVFSMHARLRRGSNYAHLIAHILLRAAVLIVLGLLVNGFPFYNLHNLRVPGILQRIALCYATAALLYLAVGRVDKGETAPAASAQTTNTRAAAVLVTLIAGILIGYWTLLRYFPVPGFGPARYDSLGYLGAYIDRAVFTTRHLWAWGLTPGYGVTYDPEGLLSTLPGHRQHTARRPHRHLAPHAASRTQQSCRPPLLRRPALPRCVANVSSHAHQQAHLDQHLRAAQWRPHPAGLRSSLLVP
jgi:predicted acyltransferase